MKNLMKLLIALVVSLFGFVMPAMADVMLIGRGTASDGVMYVYYADGGETFRTSRADFAAAGVDIFDQSDVMAALNASSSFVGDGLCGESVGGSCVSSDSQY